jgi:hypothetical protein
VTPAQLEKIALSIQGVEPGTSYGTPAFKIKGKLIARLHQSEPSVVVRVDPDQRDVLMNADPDTFYITEHYRNHPWVLVRLARVRSGSMRSLLEGAVALCKTVKARTNARARDRLRRR